MLKKASDTVASGNVEIPRERYTLRVISAKHATSKAGNAQVVLETEILKDEPLVHKGKKVMIGGKKIWYYLPLSDDKLSQVIGEDCGSVHSKFGLPLEIDNENPNVQQYVGIIFDAILDSKEKKAMRKDDDGKYVPILDGEGKEISQGYEVNAQLGDILGLSKYDGRQAY